MPLKKIYNFLSSINQSFELGKSTSEKLIKDLDNNLNFRLMDGKKKLVIFFQRWKQASMQSCSMGGESFCHSNQTL